MNECSYAISSWLLTAFRWKRGTVHFCSPHQWLLQELERFVWSLGSESSWRHLKQSHELPTLVAHSFWSHQAWSLLPAHQDNSGHHSSSDTSVTFCIHVRAHKYAFRPNWQEEGIVPKRTQNPYTDLVKCSSEVFSFSVSAFRSSLPHRWSNTWLRRRVGHCRLSLDCLSVCSTHTAYFQRLIKGSELLQRERSDQVSSGQESFSHVEREAGQIHHKHLFFSDVQTLSGPALCLGPPAASAGSCQGSKRETEVVATHSS